MPRCDSAAGHFQLVRRAAADRPTQERATHYGGRRRLPPPSNSATRVLCAPFRYSGASVGAPAERFRLVVEVEEVEAPLFVVEAPARRQRRAARHLGEVLVQEHVGDELLPRGDAEFLVEALDMVLD